MKKVFSAIFFCVLASYVSGAMAYDSPNGKCYGERPAGSVQFDYIVYFENDRPQTGETDLAKITGLADCVTELKNKLNETVLDADTRILLLATTDKKASHAYNDALSRRRLDVVKKLLDSAHSARVITHLAGETNDNFTGTGNNRNPDQRSVRIMIAGAKQVDEYVKSTAAIQSSVKISIGQTAGSAESTAQRILNIVSDLNRMTAGLGASVWKNKDGNFNTSRLASDSIAGVVLGTAGGLITSNVIKKNQLKGGFEDIKCTIGGQIVAEYNDDFVVGIRR